MATSVLHLSLSQQARPHGVACAFMTLAVAAAIHLRRRPTWARYALAGLAAGLAAGALQSGLAVVPALAVAHMVRERSERPAPFWRIVLSAAVIAVLIVVFYPLIASQTKSLFERREGHIVQGTHNVDLSHFDGTGFPVMLWSLWSYEPMLLVLGAIALPIVLRRWPRARGSRRDLWVALAFVLPYALVFGIFRGFQERMLLPLVPWLAILATFPLDAALKRAPRRTWVIAAAALLVLAVPAALAVRLSSLRARDDTIEQCAQWVEQHLQPATDVAVVTFPLDVPLFQGRHRARRQRQP
jgi:4-amino-4-deoxy-L-arabinose transferase-like glycosyltransferase